MVHCQKMYKHALIYIYIIGVLALLKDFRGVLGVSDHLHNLL